MTAIASLLSTTAVTPPPARASAGAVTSPLAPTSTGAVPLASFLDLLAPTADAVVPAGRQRAAAPGNPLPPATGKQGDGEDDPALAWLGVGVQPPAAALAAPVAVELPGADGAASLGAPPRVGGVVTDGPQLDGAAPPAIAARAGRAKDVVEAHAAPRDAGSVVTSARFGASVAPAAIGGVSPPAIGPAAGEPSGTPARVPTPAQVDASVGPEQSAISPQADEDVGDTPAAISASAVLSRRDAVQVGSGDKRSGDAPLAPPTMGPSGAAGDKRVDAVATLAPLRASRQMPTPVGSDGMTGRHPDAGAMPPPIAVGVPSTREPLGVGASQRFTMVSGPPASQTTSSPKPPATPAGDMGGADTTAGRPAAAVAPSAGAPLANGLGIVGAPAPSRGGEASASARSATVIPDVIAPPAPDSGTVGAGWTRLAVAAPMSAPVTPDLERPRSGAAASPRSVAAARLGRDPLVGGASLPSVPATVSVASAPPIGASGAPVIVQTLTSNTIVAPSAGVAALRGPAVVPTDPRAGEVSAPSPTIPGTATVASATDGRTATTGHPALDIRTPPAAPLAADTPAAAAPTSAPAARVFAEAIHRALGEQDARQPGDPTPLAPAPTHQIGALAGAGATQQGTLDLRQQHWPQAMIERIVQLRDLAAEHDTRLRLSPDMLGAIDVSLKRDGDAVQVQITAEQPQTRQLLADAQPRLAELADARGVKLHLAGGQAGMGGHPGAGTGAGAGSDAQRQSNAPATPLSSRPRSAAERGDADDTDQRIA